MARCPVCHRGRRNCSCDQPVERETYEDDSYGEEPAPDPRDFALPDHRERDDEE